jgi:hypothetical protein
MAEPDVFWEPRIAPDRVHAIGAPIDYSEAIAVAADEL